MPPASYLKPTQIPEAPPVDKNGFNKFHDLEIYILRYRQKLKMCNADKQDIKQYLEKANENLSD